MKFSAVFLLIFALVALSYAESLAESPDALSDEKRFFWPQVQAARAALAKLQAAAASFCKINYPALSDPLKRACSCVNVFSFLGDEEKKMELANKNSRRFIGNLWKKFTDMIKNFCKSEFMQDSQRLNDLCHCLTGKLRG